MNLPIKLPRALVIGLMLLASLPTFGQQSNVDPLQVQAVAKRREGAAETPSTLAKFDLDFPGGTPGELVAAMQKAMGRPLNAIVPTEFAEAKLPPIKMRGVDAAQLFKGLFLASQMTRRQVNPDTGELYNSYRSTAGFRTNDEPHPTNDSVWFFSDDGPSPTFSPPKVSRFYLLTPYLERGLSVDDITTAIQTGWKMLGYQNSPSISFHKETNLLIAVGQPAQLATIDDVLKALSPPKPMPPGGRKAFNDAANPSTQP